MRKVNPQDVCTAFINQVDAALAHYERVILALQGSSNVKLDTSLMSKSLLHQVFVDFECFLSDLFIAYLNRDFTQFHTKFESEAKKAIKKDKHSQWLIDRVTFTRPSHLTLDELAEAIDPTGWNTTFKNCADMKDRARKWLVKAHADHINKLDVESERLIDTSRTIRNCIAHQSTGSKRIMNLALANIEQGPGTPNHELGRGVREVQDVGAYLKAQIEGGARAQVYARRLKEVAQLLIV
ncbi:hypothetical protein G7Z99_09685 [Pseudomonas entomophila]|uniref:hypothetical protein n=1 Tax=Pseudomonas entomophila TaxID=312306 RepID=UPI0015E2BFFC|nr:hypothetical protein [Pseudomonas entomophila]MBA1189321.1 hypothetical protein [Pseudomonas entomophila]